MRLLVAALLGGSAAVSMAAGGGELQRKVETYLAPLVAARDFNGVVLIARGDKPIAQKAYGMANWELGAPMTMRARFRIASITKTFTGAAVVMLAERGKLSYDDPLSKYVPDFPNGGKITVRQLLLHESGVGNPDSEACSDASLDDLIREIAGKPLAFEPGTSSRYSNGGYALLARVVEKASGKSWQDFLRDEITVPLSLSDTAAERQAPILPMRVGGYIPGPGAVGLLNAPCAGAWAAIGSGALISSAGDLQRWARAVRQERLFKRKALEHPYGWGVRKYFDRDAIEQSGIVNGAASYLAVYLDDDVSVVVLSNVQTGALTEIGKGLAALAFGATPPKLVPSPAAVSWAAGERRKWIGRFANPEIATIEISEREGALALRWGNSREFVYLTPTGPSAVFDRQDTIAMELTSGGAVVMKWPSGDSKTFPRVD